MLLFSSRSMSPKVKAEAHGKEGSRKEEEEEEIPGQHRQVNWMQR